MQLELQLPRARRADPPTSHAAASRAARFSESHAGRIHVALIGLKQATAHELAHATGLTVVQIDRRLPDLRAAGLARVAERNGVMLVRGGFRVWEAA
jgi:predicted ArsR family transcriptional regulator